MEISPSNSSLVCWEGYIAGESSSNMSGLSGIIGDGNEKRTCEEDEGRSCGEGDGRRFCDPVLPSHSFCDTLLINRILYLTLEKPFAIYKWPKFLITQIQSIVTSIYYKTLERGRQMERETKEER